MQIPIINGIYTNESSDIRMQYPRNLMPIAQPNGINNGYLRPADGIQNFTNTGGTDRGGINWNGTLYRVINEYLTSISNTGAITNIGIVGGSEQVSFAYSFDRLAVASNNNLFYWDGTTFQQVTDPDLGTVLDVVWVDGYFMTTDGEFLVITDIDNPLSVNPLKYGSSEVDPDPIESLIKLRNEIYALNRYTIEVFDNIGGTGFPFRRIDNAQMTKGTLGTHCNCRFDEVLAFLGSGQKEAPAIYLGVAGNVTKISTREIDQILMMYDEATLSATLMESRISEDQKLLYLHLPDVTLVYDENASKKINQSVWFELTSGIEHRGQYLAKNMVWVYDKWIVGHPTEEKIGYLTSNVSTHWGMEITWEINTPIIYNESNGAIVHSLELVALTGRVDLADNPYINTQYSEDGETWSQEKTIKAGLTGNRERRLVWRKQGILKNYRIQKLTGTSKAHLSPIRLEAELEPLAW